MLPIDIFQNEREKAFFVFLFKSIKQIFSVLDAWEEI